MDRRTFATLLLFAVALPTAAQEPYPAPAKRITFVD
jgi:hypothetical protein